MPDAWGEVILERRELLLAWREGLIQLAVNRELLVRYMRLMHRLGLSESLLRRWGWWFNSSKKCILARENPTPMNGGQLCKFVAQEAKAGLIVFSSLEGAIIPEGGNIPRISLQEYVTSLNSQQRSEK